MQIHGELRFKDHVTALVVHSSFRGNSAIEATIKRFSEKTGCAVVWMAETAEERRSRLSRMAEEEARLASELAAIEAAKWTCWHCGVVCAGGAKSCLACSTGKPNPMSDGSSRCVCACVRACVYVLSP